MKTTRRRSLFILLLTLGFIFGLCYFIFQLSLNNGTWVNQPYNGHVNDNGGLSQAGVIYDRNKAVLAQTVNGKRTYNSDKDTRKAMLHVVGDNSINISTAVQSIFRNQLSGYNMIWGLGLPQNLKSSKDITLTLDSKACKAAYEAFDGRKGACVVYNYKTGEVLCSVSCPTYDPDNPPVITDKNAKQYDGVYLDKAISSAYPPGSTFKVITAAAAIKYVPDIFSKTFYCNGKKEISGAKVTCMEHHGNINFKDALAQSCNIAFADITLLVGKDNMAQTANQMGFNQSFDVSGIPTATSNYNVSNADDNELAWSGIGQAKDMANPMQMAVIMGGIANGGTPVMPYMIEDQSPAFLGLFGNNQSGRLGKQILDSDVAAKLNDMLRYDVTSHYGDNMFHGLKVCAKTGTAEVGNGDPDAWMIGYSQDEDCPLAFAVVVEHGGYGYSVAGPIAVAAMDAAKKDMAQ
ncbi:MAG: penicillin-binding transpeptidase domain-containing protein [Bacillota bacterium]|nr:penicillin-binding transpeptidase domain-containing protein [Bacillota bacterium]